MWSVSGNSAPSCAQSARTPWTFCLQRDLSTETELLWCLWHLSPHCCFTFLSCSTLSSEKLCWSRNTLSLFSGVSYWQFSSAIIAHATSALLHDNKESKIGRKVFKVLGTKIHSWIWQTLYYIHSTHYPNRTHALLFELQESQSCWCNPSSSTLTATRRIQTGISGKVTGALKRTQAHGW